ncbi:MAG: hypothetical protein AAGF20_00340 [Pseudomonadota bacterium]
MKAPTRINRSGLATPRTNTSNAGRGLAIVGDMLDQVSADIERQYEQAKRQAMAKDAAARRSANAQANARLSADARFKWGKELIDRSQSIQGDGSGFSATFETDFDTWATETLAGVPADRRDAVQTDLTQIRMGLALDAFKIERQSQTIYAERGVNDTLEALQNAVLVAPNEFEGAVDTFAKGVLGLDIFDDQTKAAAIAEGTEKIGAAYVDAMVQKDPDLLLQRLRSGELDGDLSPKTKQAGLKGAQAELKRRADEAERERRLIAAETKRQQDQKNMMTLIEQSALADSHIQSLGASGVPVDGFDRAAYERVASPRAWSSFVAKEAAAIKAFEVTADMPGLSEADIVDLLQKEAPKPGASNYAAQSEVFQAIQSVAGNIMRARTEDPAAYVFAQSQPVQEAQAALNALESDASVNLRIAANEQVIEASLAEQRRLGIPQRRQSPLPKAAAQALVADYEMATESDGGKALIDLVERAASYGVYTPEILAQLKSEGLPSDAEAVLALQGDAGGQAVLARAVTQWDTVKQNVSQGDRNDIREDVVSALDPLLSSFARVQNAESVSLTAVEAAYKIAVFKAMQGQSPKSAARDAAAVFNRRYQFADGMRVPARIANGVGSVAMPLGRVDKRVSGAEALAYGARRAIDNLTENEGAELLFLFGDPRLGDDRRAITADAVRASGQFVTNRLETGVYLTVGADGVFVPVLDKDGQRIEYTFEDLESLARQGEAVGRERSTFGFGID